MSVQSNPLLSEWNTPYGMAPFGQIQPQHFIPAFEAAFAAHCKEIAAIVQQTDTPDFANTIEALESCGQLLNRVAAVFFLLTAADACDELRALEGDIAPRYAAHRSAIYTRTDLYRRVAAVCENPPPNLSEEQLQLLKETHKAFVRAGAALADPERTEIARLDEQLSRLQTRFGQNIVKDSNRFELVLENAADLKGLPQSVLAAAAQEATARGYRGKYVFTLSRSSITPFLQFSERRQLRERIWQAYIHCGDNGNAFDNNATLAQIAALRARRARLLGYPSHADYILDDRMAGTPAAVNELLDRIWQPAQRKVKAEAADLQAQIQAQGANFPLAPWDWWYYTEKRRAQKYDLDTEALKPYFRLENVRDGAFAVAGKLYGLRFSARDDIPVYHQDVRVFEVRDDDDSLLGLLLTDYFMRPSKRSGAWMSALRRQSNQGEWVHPIIVNVCNFPQSKPEPCLLGLEEVRTLFHEFGHALHGLLSKVTYRSLAGTSVKRDFVELPSQIMEHWAVEPEVLQSYARHYQSGAAIPAELIDKILAMQTFNQGFATIEYLAASYLDMKWHELGEAEEKPVEVYENQAMREIGLIEEIAPRYRSTYFQHIFSGGYSAGYYSYIWAEVLDTDGYEAFRQNGLFDRRTAQAFRTHILERGGSADPMELYVRFRGHRPGVAPLLKSRGLNQL